MPFINVTEKILNEESKKIEEILANDPEARLALEQFEAECKLRRELMEARRKETLTQAEIQALTGLTQQTISRIESNHDISPSLRNLIKYAGALGYELTLAPKENRV
jgi:DNA-binding XRE family transcriptional regulator